MNTVIQNNKSKGISVFLCFALVLGLFASLPLTASAATNGTTLTLTSTGATGGPAGGSITESSGVFSGTGWSWDTTSTPKKLTLNSFSLSTNIGPTIMFGSSSDYLLDNIAVELIGNNTVVSTESVGSSYGATSGYAITFGSYFSGSLTLQGTGSLTATGARAGILVSNIQINTGCTLNALVTASSGTGNMAVYGNVEIPGNFAPNSSGMTVTTGASLTIPSGLQLPAYPGVTISNNYGTITNNSTLAFSGSTGLGGASGNYGAITNNGTITISSSPSYGDGFINNGSITNHGALTFSDSTTNSGTITNNGTITISTSKYIETALIFINNGIITNNSNIVNHGILTNNNTLTINSGSITGNVIDNKGTINGANASRIPMMSRSTSLMISSSTETQDNTATEGWAWNKLTKTLTLTNFTMEIWTTGGYGGIYFDNSVTGTIVIEYKGNNLIFYNGFESSGGISPMNSSSLILQGTGSLSTNGLFAESGNLEIISGNVTVPSMYSNGDLIIRGGNVNVNATGDYNSGIRCNGDVIISGGTVNTTGDRGIYSSGDIKIYGGNVTATGTSYGMFASGIIFIDPSAAGGVKASGSTPYNKTPTNTDNSDGSNNYSISINSVTIANIPDQTYIGTAISPPLTVNYYGNALTAGKDYILSAWTNNINVGTSTATIVGIGGYTGTKDLSFTINPANVSVFDVSPINDQVYSNSAKKPAIVVKHGNLALEENMHYTVSHTNNKQIGKAAVEITGKGNYTGTMTVIYNINPKSTSVSKLISAKKSLKVTWKKIPGITKYQVKYRTGKGKWTTKEVVAKKGSLTIKKLKKGKTYQVQVRSCKTVNGQKYYSSWSRVKTSKKVK